MLLHRQLKALSLGGWQLSGTEYAEELRVGKGRRRSFQDDRRRASDQLYMLRRELLFKLQALLGLGYRRVDRAPGLHEERLFWQPRPQERNQSAQLLVAQAHRVRVCANRP